MRYIIMLVVAALAVVGIGLGLTMLEGDDRPDRPVADFRIGSGPSTMADALAEADRKVANSRARLEQRPGEWLRQEMLAIALAERFRLTGDHADIAAAEMLLDEAFKIAPEPSGPTLTAASLALTNHGLDTADRMIARYDSTAAQLPGQRSQADALRGDILFQRGDIESAAKAYAVASPQGLDIGGAMRRANALLWGGEPMKARETAEVGLKGAQLPPSAFARSALFMANLSYATGDISRAGEWVAAANSAFDGYWLADAYAGQQLAAEGDTRGSIDALEKLARQHAEPDLIDTLVGVLLYEGEDARAAKWKRRASALWDQKLEVSREAYRLHAAEHHLDFGDPAIALELAREEVAARPFGEAIEVLASALNANDRPADALRWLERAEADGWRAVSLDLARSEALTMLGRDREAKTFLDRARKTNPLAGTEERKLVRFGHF